MIREALTTRLEADLLIPGSGEPIRNGCVVFEGSTILYAGPVEGAPRGTPSDTTVGVPVVLPGLWDAHTHFLGVRGFDLQEQVYTTPWVAVARAVQDARRALESGFTSVRELGGLGIYIARAINEGSIPGPHVYASGGALSQTGGHGDAHAFPIEYVRRQRELFGMPGPCDGVSACIEAVRSVLRLGADVIKVYASGGLLSYQDSPVHQQFSDDELNAMVAEARRADRVVAAHCHGAAGIAAAIRARVHTIEHGTYLDDEMADSMRERAMMLVPTRMIIAELASLGPESKLNERVLAKARSVLDQHQRALRLAVRKGVAIALGTDIACSQGKGGMVWGSHGKELRLLVEEGGMTPLQAIEAATANGPRTLGPQAPNSGQLAAGYPADILVVSDDPLREIDVLAQPGKILYVWKDGKRVAGARRD